MSDLVKRLRSKNCCDATKCNCDEAADRIDALEAENKALREMTAYIAGTNADHLQCALAGNPIVIDAVVSRARALLAKGDGK